MPRVTLRKGHRGKDVRALQQKLIRLGFRIAADGKFGPSTETAVRDFKRLFAFWNLPINGQYGPRARVAMRFSLLRGGKCSKSFYFRDFKSNGNGWIRGHRDLARGIEKLLKLGHRKSDFVSFYRDPAYNKQVGGATNSQHKYGNACDVYPRLRSSTVRNLGIFSGIGIQSATGLVRHVDVRHVGPNNTTGGSPKNPTIWYYG